MLKRTSILGLLALSSLASLGCAGELIPPPVLSDAPLGRIIIYRNGVAYFERYTTSSEETLSIRVPAERVDDFLKSLTILDEETGETMPVSFPTVEPDGGEVEMNIELPKGPRRLRISYVTESPAWKPTYRLVLADQGPARIQAWAVVDNVSGEDWNQVKVGVGSTSALSFRYDLHSVRLVERETLSADSPMALAPPTGGSPYAVATRKIRVLGNLSAGDLDELAALDEPVAMEQRAYAPSAVEGDYGGGEDEETTEEYSRPTRGKAGARGTRRRDAGRFAQSLSNQLRGSSERIRIEGFAQSGDSDPKAASLARANQFRNQLVEAGVPEAQIDVVATGKMNNREAVRVVAASPEAELPVGEQAKAGEGELGAAEDQPLGSAHFVSSVPMDVASDHSALISILNSDTEAERVYFYDPISSRGSAQFAFNAVRFKNPSDYTLDSGPFTVYAASQFLGEGLSEPILPHAHAFIPYALDRSIVADPAVDTREEIDRLLTIQRGIVTTETQRIRRTKLTLSNRGSDAAKIYVRHQVQPGYELRKGKAEVEKLGGAYLFPLTVEAGKAEEIAIEESTPIMKTVDIRTPHGIGAIELYLRTAKLDPTLAGKLREIVDAQKRLADLEERIVVLDEQMVVYRTRVDELNVQLVTLRKVAQAARLSRHLSDKMQEISEKLQQATIQMTDLKTQQMTLRIELQDKLADLTLVTKDETESEKAPATAPKPGAPASGTGGKVGRAASSEASAT